MGARGLTESVVKLPNSSPCTAELEILYTRPASNQHLCPGLLNYTFSLCLMSFAVLDLELSFSPNFTRLYLLESNRVHVLVKEASMVKMARYRRRTPGSRVLGG